MLLSSMSCQFPGCTKFVFPGSAYCSKTHRDAVRRAGVGSTELLCQIPGCSKPVFPGSQYCSKSHRDSDPGNTKVDGVQKAGTSPKKHPHPGNYPGSSTPKHRVANFLTRHKPIYFYARGKKYFEFTNFSDHPIQYNMKVYPTSEHLFQSFKFMNEHDAESIRRQPNSRAAFDEARRLSDRVRTDWITGNINIKMMEKTLLLKFTQHEELRYMLLKTGEAPLVEDSPIDPFWGNGQDKQGRNELGKALVKIRGILRNLG